MISDIIMNVFLRFSPCRYPGNFLTNCYGLLHDVFYLPFCLFYVIFIVCLVVLIRSYDMKSEVSTAEAAKILGVHIRTVKSWIDKGLLPARRIGPRGHWRIPTSALTPEGESVPAAKVELTPLEEIRRARLDAQNSVLAQDSQKALAALDRIQVALARLEAQNDG
jgi:excisionase family DNA binding protein